MSHKCTKHFWNRREFLFRSSGGIGGLALASVLNQHGLLSAADLGRGCATAPAGVNPFAPKLPHFKPRATAVVSLFMTGAPSQVRHVRPQARPDEICRGTDRREGERRHHRAAGLPWSADAEPIYVQEVRAERH